MSRLNAFVLQFGALAQRVRLHGALAWVILGANPITIDQFFNSLYGKLTAFALAISTFFFAWAALQGPAMSAPSSMRRRRSTRRWSGWPWRS
jgi:hypothetical protein